MIHLALEQRAELSWRDPDRKVFGARKHQYRSTLVETAAVEHLEAYLGVPLPAEYREFLLRVGSGAGPYYGVWGPDEALSELNRLGQEYLAEEGKAISPAASFPLTAEDLRDIALGMAAGVERFWVERDWPCDGCLPICEQGCTYYSVLALTGEFTGRVFDLNNAFGYYGEWLPARRPPGCWELEMPNPHELPRLPSPPTFGQWFSGWVEQCLSDLPACRTKHRT
ncbi:MAG: SMI1/KNR4 family protein [Bradymonadales bacterium]|nr:SMI1/KNR4 family protein [Bradymonadales bacterium]